ncbi:MAG: hypothetical protein JEY99_10930 [Spirochaetales bacterium]|nr:hypothetical protein [Spirochaetales bacterium]
MRNVEEINKEIEDLKIQRECIQGSTTEVYTRIVGYYRSVRNWNKGKRQEFDERVTFQGLNPAEENRMEFVQEVNGEVNEGQGDLFNAEGTPASYIYFYRQTCPNCPPVKSYLEDIRISGIEADVDTLEGLEEAKKWDIMASPTVIILDEDGNEISRTSRLNELEVLLPQKIEAREEAALEV